MREQKVLKIDYSRERLRERANKYYDEGNYLSALRFTYKEMSLYGGDEDTYSILSDIYENMELYASAINCWFHFMDHCAEEDLPDAYESLAVNYLNMGNESMSAFYYEKLMDTDDTLTYDNKMEIAEAFSKDKRSNFRFVYPPSLVDHSKDIESSARALKNGNCKRAISILSSVEKGSPDYEAAREMQAVAYMLSGNAKTAEKICLELCEENPSNIQAFSTLAAIYTDQKKYDESKEIALKLYHMDGLTSEEAYKVAMVCCENNLHEQALEKFLQVEKDLPYDGNMLYFKAVAAYNCGKLSMAIDALETLFTIYPDAVVAEYYLKLLRRYQADPDTEEKPELTYFYRLPVEEREFRCRTLVQIGKAPRDEAELYGELAMQSGYFRWCFDEMDGMELDLQQLAIFVSNHARADDFIREILLDCEVSDTLKLELLQLLYERNENNKFTAVICHIYRDLDILKVNIGRKRRKKFINAYAQTASKFAIEWDGKKIKKATEKIYQAFLEQDCWELSDDVGSLACAIYLLSDINEAGSTPSESSFLFSAKPEQVEKILARLNKTE